MMAGATAKRNQDDLPRWQKMIGVVLLFGSLALLGVAVVELVPHHVTNAKDPSFVDNIFANPVVLLFARIALAAGAVYVVVSVFALMGARRWLAELGPFKASRPIEEVTHAEQELRGKLEDAVQTITELNDRLVEGDQKLQEAQANIDLLIDYTARLESSRGGL